MDHDDGFALAFDLVRDALDERQKRLLLRSVGGAI
jgi:hypothetical protein